MPLVDCALGGLQRCNIAIARFDGSSLSLPHGLHTSQARRIASELVLFVTRALRLRHCLAPLHFGDVRVDARALGGLRLRDALPLRQIASELLLDAQLATIDVEAPGTLALVALRSSGRGQGDRGAPKRRRRGGGGWRAAHARRGASKPRHRLDHHNRVSVEETLTHLPLRTRQGRTAPTCSAA